MLPIIVGLGSLIKTLEKSIKCTYGDNKVVAKLSNVTINNLLHIYFRALKKNIKLYQLFKQFHLRSYCLQHTLYAPTQYYCPEIKANARNKMLPNLFFLIPPLKQKNSQKFVGQNQTENILWSIFSVQFASIILISYF